MSDKEPKRGHSASNQHWRDIRERSVLEFVNRISSLLGAPLDRSLRQCLYDIVSDNGAGVVAWQGTRYTGPMLLDLYYQARRDW